MTAIDVVRAGWTLSMGGGLLAALWLLREVLIDVYAISESNKQAIAMFKLYTEGEVWIVTLAAVALLAFFLAAACSYLGQPLLTIPLLIVGGAAVVVIPFYLHVRRRRIFAAVRLNRKATVKEAHQ